MECYLLDGRMTAGGAMECYLFDGGDCWEAMECYLFDGRVTAGEPWDVICLMDG